jgi:3-oxoacyl-[acyl-carrier-protein] synthase-1/3-oxoacyl-[acyl-carrier-protein] synthase II
MRPVDVVVSAGCSALGCDAAAWSVGAAGEPARSAIREDAVLAAAGLRRPFAARVTAISSDADADRAAALLESAACGLATELDRRDPAWRERRIGLAIGTSSGGMLRLERLLAMRAAGIAPSSELARSATYFGPLSRLDALLGVRAVERTQVLAACASSAVAIGLAARWLELGVVDLALAGGYDGVSVFVAAGFEALRATSATLPAPFRIGRDGMALGEGAALLALRRHDPSAGRDAVLLGFGASSDAVHVTAPDRGGAGLAAAARRALEDAAVRGWEVDLVSAHATATPYNDAAEARAIAAALGEQAHPVVHPFKAVIGHTLGAAGALELLAAVDCLRREVLPAAAGAGPADPDAPARLLERNQSGAPRIALKLAAAFGGANAALVAGLTPGAGVECIVQRPALLHLGTPCSEPDLDLVARHSRGDASRIRRIDRLSLLALTATARLLDAGGALPEHAGVVVGSVAATLELDETFDARRRERGARAVDPRRFPPTSPNLAPGECSIAFGLRGPALTVGAGHGAPLEALLVAYDLVACGDAPAMLVIAADDVGRVVSDVWRAAGWPVPRDGALAVVVGAGPGMALERAAIRAARASLDACWGPSGWPILLEALAAR